MTPNFLRNANAILICYDCTVKHTFQRVQNWVKDVQNVAGENVRLVLVANKIDLEDKRIITKQMGEEMAEKNNMEYSEVSALSGFGVMETFDSVVKNLV